MQTFKVGQLVHLLKMEENFRLGTWETDRVKDIIGLITKVENPKSVAGRTTRERACYVKWSGDRSIKDDGWITSGWLELVESKDA